MTMATLAIKGHATRGREVIELLEMLDGKNESYCDGGFTHRIYFINENGYIKSCDRMHHLDYSQFTLEEFLQKFSYKVGDKVIYNNKPMTITKMTWEEQTNTIAYKLDDKLYCNVMEELQPYTEQNETNKVVFDANAQSCAIMHKIIQKEETMEETTQLVPLLDKDTNEILYYTDKKTGINYAPMGETTLHLIDGYELVDENGNVINAKKITLTKKQPQYPKNYRECCDILGLNTMANDVMGYKHELLIRFQELLIARDAYWKIAGDWKPNYNDDEQDKWGILKLDSNGYQYGESTSFVFPTEEMRDAFYENFKDLIEECKELL